MYKCTNTECIIETLAASVDSCPVCNGDVEAIKEPEAPTMTLEEAEAERRYWLAIESEERRMYGDPREDFDSMFHRPTMVTNEEGEPVRWE